MHKNKKPTFILADILISIGIFLVLFTIFIPTILFKIGLDDMPVFIRDFIVINFGIQTPLFLGILMIIAGGLRRSRIGYQMLCEQVASNARKRSGKVRQAPSMPKYWRPILIIATLFFIQVSFSAGFSFTKPDTQVNAILYAASFLSGLATIIICLVNRKKLRNIRSTYFILPKNNTANNKPNKKQTRSKNGSKKTRNSDLDTDEI